MGFRVKIAETREELDALFRCRHRVYVGQDGWTPRDNGMIVDECDAWPASDCVNFIALCDGEVVAGMRLLLHRKDRRTSSDWMFDFEPHFREGTKRMSASMLCVDARHKAGAARMTNCLMSIAYHYCINENVDELYGCIRHSLWPVSERMGGRALAEVQLRGTIAWVPFVFEMRLILEQDPWGRFIRDHDVREFLGIWSRAFLAPGELVYARGDDAEEAFVVVSGRVELRPRGAPPLAIERPWLFGDEEMIEGRHRAYDAVAATHLDLIVVDRAAFFAQVAAQPEGAVKFARTLIDPSLLQHHRDLADTLDFPDAVPDVANAPDLGVALRQQARMGD